MKTLDIALFAAIGLGVMFAVSRLIGAQAANGLPDTKFWNASATPAQPNPLARGVKSWYTTDQYRDHLQSFAGAGFGLE